MIESHGSGPVGSGRVKRFQSLAGRVGSGRVGSGQEAIKSHGLGPVGSRGFKISRVGSGDDPRDTGHVAGSATLTRQLFFL